MQANATGKRADADGCLAFLIPVIWIPFSSSSNLFPFLEWKKIEGGAGW